jgi:hypothetical protein
MEARFPLVALSSIFFTIAFITAVAIFLNETGQLEFLKKYSLPLYRPRPSRPPRKTVVQLANVAVSDSIIQNLFVFIGRRPALQNEEKKENVFRQVGSDLRI